MSPANNVLHFAVQADDLDRARSFYSAVFGWRFEAWGPPDFFRIFTGTPEDPGIAGALEKRRVPLAGESTTGFVCTVSVADVASTRALVEQHGGKVELEAAIPTVGTMIHFEDPEGNRLSAMQYEPQALDDIRHGR